jgi:tripartite-type tricarboxylate transporter receptor subunit TctC
MQRRRIVVGSAAAGATLLGGPFVARAQSEWPTPGGTLRYVVPFAAGGLTDVLARLVAQRLAENWKVNVLVDNRAGANAQLGADFVAKGPSDGSQILAITQSHAVNVSLFPNAPFSFTRDLRPLALLADSAMLVVVPANSTIRDFKQLVTVSKTKALNASSAGSGSGPHLTLELFNDLNGSKIQHVPYKGGAPSITDLIAGHVDVSFSNLPNSLSFVKDGRLRALAVCSMTRHPDVPEVPTAREAGMPDLVVENWTAVMAPAKTPDAIAERYSRELVKIMNTPDIADKAAQRGYRVNAKGADEFGPYLKSEIERWGRVVRTAKITPD